MTMLSDLAGLDAVVDVLFAKCQAHPKIIILLRGDLASGKTTLVERFARRLSVQGVSSPTFSFQHIYDFEGGRILHYDCYSKSIIEALELGILEMLDSEGWHFVEWGDSQLEKILRESGFAVILVEIAKQGDQRSYRIEE
ncbi:tRNA (N6-adenosine(37)-N6)-threonylcarbamoyltransferase complex ATPase TsaE [Helicobacter enhydrae]|uniref:tRNA threonylcarbamoyladenosine biosynthesis protein TsaE n=1 Tax=Helicobacter enhydrae TaxID=222136 RepID=A0A1B1U516_9HELI|nr:tRNA (adenosine(37)-N6)-threonylcarbamoyltransferase complex ATPase subunit type 1 TsaE [Helicobacter enhydrae]ANV97848.1 tRNA (N6-adenosine(37)-N6)-threonylcarbamoyltransferase complex ATPase TsaE [Helicobacter enhydrae]